MYEYTFSSDKNKHVFTVTFSTSIIQDLVTEEIENSKKKLSIKGFRKGKVPSSKIPNYIYLEALEKVTHAIVEEIIQSIIKKENLTPIGKINYEIINDNSDESKVEPKEKEQFSFKFSLVTKPEIDLSKIDNVQKPIEKPIEVSETELNNFIKSYLEFTYTNKDVYNLSFGKYIIKEDENNNIEELKQSDLYTLNNGTKINLTDDLISDLKLPNIKNVSEFKDYATEILNRNKSQQMLDERVNYLVEEINKIYDFFVPDSALEDIFSSLLNRVKESIKQNNMTLDEYLRSIGKTEYEYTQELYEYSEKKVRFDILLSLLYEELAKKNANNQQKDEIKDEQENNQTKNLDNINPDIIYYTSIYYLIDKVYSNKSELTTNSLETEKEEINDNNTKQ